MELIPELNLDQIIIKAVKKNGISEIWYKKDDGAIIKPIFQTPRLKIIYGAKKYQNQNTYSYCVSLHNNDIDEEVECFYNLLSLIDEQIRFTTAKSGKTYKSTLYRKTKESDYSMRIRLIDNGTVIKNAKGKLCTPEDILYGDYADQYIGLDCLIYNEDTIIPIWNAHQVVLTKMEKIFLGVCLLDSLYGKQEPETTGLMPSAGLMPSIMPSAGLMPSTPSSSRKHFSPSPLSAISLNDILQVQGKLKKIV